MMREKNITSSAYTFFVYDASDERIGVITCPAENNCGQNYWTWSLRDENGKVLRQFESNFGATILAPWTWIEDYVYRDGLLLGSERPLEEGGRRHFHLDHLGSPRLETNDLGQRMAEHDYYPFGVEIPPQGGTIFQDSANGYDREEPMRFTGQERDLNTGNSPDNNSNYNDSMHARQTVPQWGRFLSVDPVIDMKRAMTHPQAWNRYSYVENNPIVLTDPNGKCPLCVLVAVGVVGGILLSDDVANAPSPFDKPIPNQGPASAIGGAMKALTAWGAGNAITRGVTQLLGGSTDSKPSLQYGEKIQKDMGKRGWDQQSVERTVNDPARTQEGTDARNLPGGGKMNDPATVYFDKDGSYVVVNNRTGDVVQVSTRNDPNWMPPEVKK